MSDETLLKLGISRCLLGDAVRYDGGHKRDPWATEVLAPHVSLVDVCPEVEIGMGTPREPVALRKSTSGVRMIGTATGTDWTDKMDRYSTRKVHELQKLGLSGYILKSDSPSCGLHDVHGLFARHLTTMMPNLPVEEESRLEDRAIRDNFIERLFSYRRMAEFFSRKRTLGQLVMFHSQSRLQLMSHDPRDHHHLRFLVANAMDHPWKTVASEYQSGFMKTMKKNATRPKHVAVMKSACRHFKNLLDQDELQGIVASIDDYAKGIVPLIVPLSLLQHQVRTLEVGALEGQTYLEPDPVELLLRYHA